MTVGDASDWDGVFARHLIPSMLALVLEAWNRIEKPADDEYEDKITLRLYKAMANAKDRSRHPFLIRVQDPEVDAELDLVAGRKDIVFYPGSDENVYYCLEAKRLNALVGGARRNLAGEYVKDGMQRFVNRQYGGRVRHGGMLGYVQDGDIARAMDRVARSISTNCKALLMRPPGAWTPLSLRPGDPHARETVHWRRRDSDAFRIHHVFVTR